MPLDLSGIPIVDHHCHSLLRRQPQDDEARERTSRWENDAESGAIFCGQELMRSSGDRLGLLLCVYAGEKKSRPRGSCVGINREELRFAQRFFPRADPRGIEIVGFFARILQDDGGVRRRLHGCAQQMPERPVSAVKSGD